jgi:NADPH:quinone reductase
VIGLNIGILIQAAPQIFGEVMGELFGRLGAAWPNPSCRDVHKDKETSVALLFR